MSNDEILTKEEIIWCTEKTSEFASLFEEKIRTSTVLSGIVKLLNDYFEESLLDNAAEIFQDAIREEAYRLVRNLLAGDDKLLHEFVTRRYKYDLLPEIRKKIFASPVLKGELQLALSYDNYTHDKWVNAFSLQDGTVSYAPQENVLIDVLLTKNDDTFLNDDGRYKYIESKGCYNTEGKYQYDLPICSETSRTNISDWRVVWWKYRSPHPMHLKPSKQENNNE